MTDTTVTALTEDEISAKRKRHSPVPVANVEVCSWCGRQYPCEWIRALDALDAAQRRVAELTPIVDAARAYVAEVCREVGEGYYLSEVDKTLEDLIDTLAAPHDAEESAND